MQKTQKHQNIMLFNKEFADKIILSKTFLSISCIVAHKPHITVFFIVF